MAKRPALLPTVQVGDCCELLQRIESASIDLCIGDPPYNIGYAYDTEFNAGDKLSPDQYLAWSKRWIDEVHRVLKANGAFWLACHWRYVSELDCLAKQLGFVKQDHVLWYYSFGANQTKGLTNSVTHWLYFTKGARGTFNADAIRVPSARQAIYNDKRANPKGRLPDTLWILRPQEVPEGFQPLENAWHIPRIAGTFKRRSPGAANQIPEELLARIIQLCSNAGETVLDPFCGTGSTAATAKKLGRNFLTMELSSDVAALATRRILATKVGDPLDGPLQVRVAQT